MGVTRKSWNPASTINARAEISSPFDWNAQPGLRSIPQRQTRSADRAGSPLSWRFELSDRLSHFLAATALEALRINHYNVVNILDAAVLPRTLLLRQIKRSGRTSSRAKSSCRAPASMPDLQKAKLRALVPTLVRTFVRIMDQSAEASARQIRSPTGIGPARPHRPEPAHREFQPAGRYRA